MESLARRHIRRDGENEREREKRTKRCRRPHHCAAMPEGGDRGPPDGSALPCNPREWLALCAADLGEREGGSGALMAPHRATEAC